MDYLLTCHLQIVMAKLKTELDSGLLPKSLYEEMVRDAIAEFGSDPYDSSPAYRPGLSGPPHMGGNIHGNMNPNFGETVAVLTPIQQAVLDAIGDIDVSSIIPFIRRQRKKLLRQSSDTNKSGKSRVFCPECSKDFMNTQGLSTHLLAKHRRGLDDYNLDNTTNMYILRSQHRGADVPITSASQTSDTFDISRLETADTMANLVSAAIERSIDDTASDAIDGGSMNSSDEENSMSVNQTSKLNPWNKSHSVKDSQDSLSTIAYSGTQLSINNGPESLSSQNKLPRDMLSSSSKDADDGIDRLATVSASQPILPSTTNDISSRSSAIQSSKMSAISSQHLLTQSSGVTAEMDSDSDSSVGRHDIEPKTDRRRFNRGTQQRKSYSKDTKLSVIGMRDQGKCTDEISMTMGIPKSNVEKWCSAKGREKILRDIYKDVVNHRPQVYGMPTAARGYFNNDSESQSLPSSQSSTLPSTYRSLSTMPLFADLNPRGTMHLNGLQSKDTSSVKPLASYSANFGVNSALGRDPRESGTFKPGFESTISEQAYLANLKSGGKLNDKRPRDDTRDRSMEVNDISRFDKRPRTTAPASIPVTDTTTPAIPVATAINLPGTVGIPSSAMPNMSVGSATGRGQKVVRRKTVPLPTASAAAAVAHTISFNNEGFSDSDDDHDVMGLLGEQVPIVALRRLTQMKQT